MFVVKRLPTSITRKSLNFSETFWPRRLVGARLSPTPVCSSIHRYFDERLERIFAVVPRLYGCVVRTGSKRQVMIEAGATHPIRQLPRSRVDPNRRHSLRTRGCRGSDEMYGRSDIRIVGR